MSVLDNVKLQFDVGLPSPRGTPIFGPSPGTLVVGGPAEGGPRTLESLMGYYSGFLPTGVGQSSAGPSILSSIAQGLETFLPAILGRRAPAQVPGVPASAAGGGAIAVPVGTVTGQVPSSHPVLTTIGAVAAGGAAAIATGGMVSTAVRSVMGTGAHGRYAPAGTKGYHMIKKGPHAGLWTRNRHRNVANIRALRRALSRAHGFERICRKVIHFVNPRKSHGRPVFRRRRRRV